jgi:hypothetical protein
MTMEEYIAYEAFSRSDLVATLETAAHGQAVIHFPKDTTDPMRLGTATHMAFLEPAEVPKHFSLYKGKPSVKRITRSGEHWEAHKNSALSQGLDPYLTVEKYDHALSMGEALRLHRKTRTLFSREPVRKEVVIVFTIKVLGRELPIKVRIDCLIEDEFPTQADIKTAASISDYSFGKSIIEYGYDIQAWLYRKAFVARTDIEVTNFVIAAIEKKKEIMLGGKLTHAVRIFEMDVWLEGGKQRGMEALGIIAHGLNTDEWPSYPDQVERLDPPDWYTKKYGGKR